MIDEKLLKTAVDWWVDQVTGQKMNWDNGAQNEGDSHEKEIGMMMFIMGNFLAKSIRSKITDEQRKTFREVLAKEITEGFKRFDLMENIPDDYSKIVLSVDYGPGEHLYKAAEEAGIDGNAFPCKTHMWITDKSVTVRLGYGAEAKVLITL